MKKIVIVSSHRAERGLLEGTIETLNKHLGFDTKILSLDPSQPFNFLYKKAYIYLEHNQPNVVIIPCDRQEAFASAIAAFLLHIPIRCHFNAGEMVKGGSTLDETFRPMISLMCNVWFCDSEGFVENIKNLLKAVGREEEIVHVYGVGKPLELKVDNSLVPPDAPYDLVLYHPPTLAHAEIPKELDEIERLLESTGGGLYWSYPNGDPGSDLIIERMKKIKSELGERMVIFDNLPRSQFLGLVKSCSHFIGNSSSMVAEAPLWLKPEQIIHIGKRNAGRQFEGVVESDPEKIVKILEDLSGCE